MFVGRHDQEERVDGCWVDGSDECEPSHHDYGGVTFEDDNPKFAACIAETDESRSEYKGPASDDWWPKMDTDDKPVCEEGHELEDEEPDTNIKLTKSKKKKGVIAQEQISAAVAAKMTNQVQG